MWKSEMTTPREKGNALEAVVEAIERHILNTSPALSEKRFLIESKKIIAVEGVHHEIDVYVTIDLGDGYTSVFIFECKNWKEAVGKNEIIIFAEKIAATQAQKGFFVAKSFTADAQAQAATNPRVSLLAASERDPTTAPLPYGFHGVLLSPEHAEATFYRRGLSHSKFNTVDLNTVSARFQGNAIDLRQYLTKWAEDASSEDVLSFRSEKVPEGNYKRATQSTRKYTVGELTLDGNDIERAESSVRYNVAVVRPRVVSYFEVESRGRVVSLAPVQIPLGPAMQIRLTSR
jgi:hypothetical protein